jgi:hypothetical protein
VILISKTQIDVKMKLLTGTWKDAHVLIRKKTSEEELTTTHPEERCFFFTSVLLTCSLLYQHSLNSFLSLLCLVLLLSSKVNSLIHFFFWFQRKERHKRKPFIGSIRTKQSSDKNEFKEQLSNDGLSVVVLSCTFFDEGYLLTEEFVYSLTFN